jgi:hypothetical protein
MGAKRIRSVRLRSILLYTLVVALVLLLGSFYVYPRWIKADDIAVNAVALKKPAIQTFFDLKANSIDGTPIEFSRYTGNVILAVNVASE